MADGPLEDYFQFKKDAAVKRTEQDMEAFEKWKKRPTKRSLSTLLRRFEPEFNRKVSLWKSPKVDAAAFKADLKKNAITAFTTFDPTRGASLRTHVNNLLKRSQRFNLKYQNMAFIPEEKAALITPVQQATDQLTQELGKAPNNKQIATFLNRKSVLLPKRVVGKVTPSLVKTVQKYQIRDIPGSAFETDPTTRIPSFERETLGLLRSTLTGDMRTVYDYMYGTGGKPQITSTGQIAKRMGKSPSQISRLKGKIQTVYKKYI
jgi:DNA-directed RNA polymerase specialized sigma subunit